MKTSKFLLTLFALFLSISFYAQQYPEDDIALTQHPLLNTESVFYPDNTKEQTVQKSKTTTNKRTFNPYTADTDGDGVLDSIDVDDDNDGILDEDEGCQNSASTFPNAEKGYLFQGNPTTVYLVDIITGASTQHHVTNYQINGVAVNEADGLFWGVDKNQNKVVLVDPVTFNIVETLNISNNSVAGAFDPIKKQYVTYNQQSVQVFDGDPNSPTYKTQVASFSGISNKGIVDLGFNTSDGSLYGIPGGTNQLYKIDTTNEQVTLLGNISGLPAGTYGAIYTTLDGSFYMSNNNSGIIYKMELRNGLSATVFANGPSSSINDGAKVINVDISGNQICLDTDDDGTYNSKDLDSDADGTFDVVEAGGVDSDNDGMLDGTGFDAEGKVTGGSGGYSGAAATATYAHQMSITTPPSDQTAGFAQAVSFTVTATAEQATNYVNGSPVFDTPGNASGRIVYQWYLGNPDTDGIPLSDTGVYSGTTTATLSISSSMGLYTNRYYVKCTHLDNVSLEEKANAQLIAEPCDALASGNPDNDGDGVADDCDLDDDNDGILDTLECEQVDGANVLITDATFTVTGGYVVSNSDVDYVSAVGAVNPPTGSDYVNGYDTAGGQPIVNVSLNNPISLSLPSSNEVIIKGYFFNYSATSSNYVSNADDNFMDITIKTTLGDYSIEYSLSATEVTKLSNKEWIPITVSAEIPGAAGTNFDITGFDWELEQINGGISPNGFDANHSEVFAFALEGFSLCNIVDTDGDGIFNYLDSDSDNDGYFDVTEAGGVDADNDGYLDGTGVDSFGRVLGGTNGYSGTSSVSGVVADKVEIITAPVNVTVDVDQTATFTVVGQASTTDSFTSGTPNFTNLGNDDANLTYQWYKGDPANGGIALQDQGVYSGCTTATLQVNLVSGLDNTDFYVVVGNGNTPTDTDNATLTVSAAAPNTDTLLISQYIESDSGTSPRCIEIFNPLSGTFNFANNNIYVNVATGASTANYTNELVINSGTLTGGSVLVIGSAEVGQYLTENGLTEVTFIQHDFNFDGDDTIILSDAATNTGNVLDMFGELGTDPGDEWSGNGVQTRNCNLSLKDYFNDNQFFTSGAASGWTNPSSRYVQTNANPSAANGLRGCGRAPVRNVWTGNTSNDFHDLNNWKNNARQNYLSDNLVIPNTGVANYPTCYSDINLNSLTIESGATLETLASANVRVRFERNFISTNWYLIGSPISGDAFDDDFVSTYNIPTANTDRAIGEYDTPTDTWDYIQVGESRNITLGTGYSIKRDLTSGPIVFNGNLNTDNVTVAIQNTGCGYNLVSNPFAANISSRDLLQANTQNLVMEAVWLWNQAEDNYEVYVAADDFTIAPTQGFLVKARNNATFAINKDVQCTNCTGTFQRNSNKSEVILNMTDGNKNRVAKLYYFDDATAGFDNGLEGRTYHGQPNQLDIYTYLLQESTFAGFNSANIKFQVQSLPNKEHEDMVVPLGITAAANQQITISANAINLPAGVKVYIEDRENNTFTDLSQQALTFTPNQNLNGIGRFYVHTKSSLLSTDDVVTNPDYVSVYKTDNNVLAIRGLQETATVKVYAIDGKEVLNTSIASNGYSEIALPSLSKGIYIVALNGESVKLSKKLIFN